MPQEAETVRYIPRGRVQGQRLYITGYPILFLFLVILSKLYGIRLGLAHISWLKYKYISVCWFLLPPTPIALEKHSY